MKKVVIIGNGGIVEVDSYYFENESEYFLAGYSINNEYINSNELKFPKHEFSVFVAVGCQKLNIVRSELLFEVKNKN